MIFFGIDRLENLLGVLGLSPYGSAGITWDKFEDSTYGRKIRQMIREEILNREDELLERKPPLPMKLYCINVEREMEDPCVLHKRFKKEPIREEVLEFILGEDLGYDDDYGRFDFWEVKE